MICKGNYVNFARFVLPAVSEEAEAWLPSFCVQCIRKQLLDSVFVISIIIIHQTHYGNSDWSRAYNQFTIDYGKFILIGIIIHNLNSLTLF